MAAVSLTIRGRVQGVGFRAFVHRTAIAFGIAGEVWNSHDGSVQAFAQHPDELHLHAFVRLLQDGPGRVDSIDLLAAPEREESGFSVGVGR